MISDMIGSKKSSGTVTSLGAVGCLILDLHETLGKRINNFSQMVVFHGDLPWYNP